MQFGGRNHVGSPPFIPPVPSTSPSLPSTPSDYYPPASSDLPHGYSPTTYMPRIPFIPSPQSPGISISPPSPFHPPAPLPGWPTPPGDMLGHPAIGPPSHGPSNPPLVPFPSMYPSPGLWTPLSYNQPLPVPVPGLLPQIGVPSISQRPHPDWTPQQTSRPLGRPRGLQSANSPFINKNGSENTKLGTTSSPMVVIPPVIQPIRHMKPSNVTSTNSPWHSTPIAMGSQVPIPPPQPPGGSNSTPYSYSQTIQGAARDRRHSFGAGPMTVIQSGTTPWRAMDNKGDPKSSRHSSVRAPSVADAYEPAVEITVAPMKELETFRVLNPFQLVDEPPKINPLLMPPASPDQPHMKWDMLYPTTYGHFAVEFEKYLWQPATSPAVTSLYIVSDDFPWMITATASHSDVGVTCTEVINAISECMYSLANEQDYKYISDSSGATVEENYLRNRSRLYGVPGLKLGIRRLDWLGTDSTFGGIEKDDAFVKTVLGDEFAPFTFVLLRTKTQLVQRLPEQPQPVEENKPIRASDPAVTPRKLPEPAVKKQPGSVLKWILNGFRNNQQGRNPK